MNVACRVDTSYHSFHNEYNISHTCMESRLCTNKTPYHATMSVAQNYVHMPTVNFGLF